MSGLINLSLRHCMELRRRIGLLCTMGGRESAEKTAGREKRDANVTSSPSATGAATVGVVARPPLAALSRNSLLPCGFFLSLLLFPTSSRDRF